MILAYVVAALWGGVPTFVFDEVDVGRYAARGELRMTLPREVELGDGELELLVGDVPAPADLIRRRLVEVDELRFDVAIVLVALDHEECRRTYQALVSALAELGPNTTARVVRTRGPTWEVVAHASNGATASRDVAALRCDDRSGTRVSEASLKRLLEEVLPGSDPGLSSESVSDTIVVIGAHAQLPTELAGWLRIRDATAERRVHLVASHDIVRQAGMLAQGGSIERTWREDLGAGLSRLVAALAARWVVVARVGLSFDEPHDKVVIRLRGERFSAASRTRLSLAGRTDWRRILLAGAIAGGVGALVAWGTGLLIGTRRRRARRPEVGRPSTDDPPVVSVVERWHRDLAYFESKNLGVKDLHVPCFDGDSAAFDIGSATGLALRLPRRSDIAPVHATLHVRREAGTMLTFVLNDAGNHETRTTVDGQILTTRAIQSGDPVVFGSLPFVFRRQGL